ncbi:PFL_4669 family integrating conjugative element protein [Thioalkalivibrio sp. ALE6]|uniref:PFL_4669 family integrating conjugative element protein n=1 Tax=Thioalkalivibrio sp. ALE6 TaxID=1266908 RepID=UPI000380441E|nr:TIGR03761 family integrating conjugative element protein [Thioalkalivibrio sp. ALE6]
MADTKPMPNEADPIVDWRTASSSPGGLRGSAAMEIQTRQAQRLVHGRGASEKKAPIIGLVRFATTMRRIWRAAALDDPWADWKLLQTYESLTENREGINALREQTERLLASMPGIEIDVAQSQSPCTVPLEFSNPYGFMGAYLIADFDRTARAILTARHVGLMGRDESERMLYQGGRLVRSAFNAPQGFQYQGVTRDDVAAGTAKARQAIENLGLPPKEVLEGTLRAPVAPDIRDPKARSEPPPGLYDDEDDDEADAPAGERAESYGSAVAQETGT